MKSLVGKWVTAGNVLGYCWTEYSDEARMILLTEPFNSVDSFCEFIGNVGNLEFVVSHKTNRSLFRFHSIKKKDYKLWTKIEDIKQFTIDPKIQEAFDLLMDSDLEGFCRIYQHNHIFPYDAMELFNMYRGKNLPDWDNSGMIIFKAKNKDNIKELENLVSQKFFCGGLQTHDIAPGWYMFKYSNPIQRPELREHILKRLQEDSNVEVARFAEWKELYPAIDRLKKTINKGDTICYPVKDNDVCYVDRGIVLDIDEEAGNWGKNCYSCRRVIVKNDEGIKTTINNTEFTLKL